jgi:hypothetical protein
VKSCVLSFVSLLLAAVGAFAQSSNTTYTTDINGYRVATAPTTSSDHTQTQLSRSVNGRLVPLEQREEKVLRKDSTGSVTETIVRKYNPEGQLTGTERVLTEQQATSGGGSSVRTTTYRSDVNGREQEAERRSVETRVAGNTTSTETSVARPTLNGSFETIEKRSSVSVGPEANKTTTESVYRASPSGGLSVALRTVTQESKSNGQTVKNVADYEPGITGQLELHSQAVSTTTKTPDGNETTQVDLYAAAADGHVQETGAKQQIKEEQIITRKKGPDGSVTETLSVRRPSVSDATHLGSLQKISETVCQGKCEPDPPAAAPAPAAPPAKQ